LAAHQCVGRERRTLGDRLAVSKIEIDDQLSANPLRDLVNLGNDLLPFGVT
jgi:hypothetical protein